MILPITNKTEWKQIEGKHVAIQRVTNEEVTLADITGWEETLATQHRERAKKMRKRIIKLEQLLEGE